MGAPWNSVCWWLISRASRIWWVLHESHSTKALFEIGMKTMTTSTTLKLYVPLNRMFDFLFNLCERTSERAQHTIGYVFNNWIRVNTALMAMEKIEKLWKKREQQQSIGLRRQAARPFNSKMHVRQKCTPEEVVINSLPVDYLASCASSAGTEELHRYGFTGTRKLLCIQWPPLIVTASHSNALDSHSRVSASTSCQQKKKKKKKIDMHSVRIDFRLKSKGIFDWKLNNK